MTYFAAVVTRSGHRWRTAEADLTGCESLADLGDIVGDTVGDVRLLLIEQDDEYAAIVRLDAGDDEPRAFLTDGHSADAYPLAAVVAEELTEIGTDDLADDEDAPPAHDSAPFGDAGIVADLGTDADGLLALCEHEGTLPVDVLFAVCEKAGCGEAFEELRG
ncbi:putative tRNA adenosine deaminase-associated protein [Jatrophihabitans endophyticus]|uniref:Putative tRNA adenosine deaminase-associated protein n=1 Tax=Jatrophihabitans endophyticus TaxID=1206085 RepID=A0A1M5HD47_9ACTN|nr:tRNA adenosine deaminase-associated protein [Jatrophihabitans endophyticus]SHG13919.1 putative tRNA adenosine deaminase-associated protein [Jatrophihabitans endophyticus]